MDKFLFGMVLSLCVFNAAAKPVYLECELSKKDEVLKFSVSVDEETGKASFVQSTGFTFKSEAIFSPNKITFSSGATGGPVKVERIFEISRVDLSASETVVINDTRLMQNGNCKIVNPENNKF